MTDAGTTRVFRCRTCGHKMRMAKDYCGLCGSMKRTWQKPSVIYTAAFVISIVIVLSMMPVP